MELHFTELIIIDSLQPGERVRSGDQLYEALSSSDAFPLTVSLTKVTTAAQFLEELRRIAARVVAGQSSPIIHLEIHGAADRTGFVMASGEFLDWDTAAGYLRVMNVAMRNSLIIVLGVCNGAFLTYAACSSPFEPAPFCGLIGPDRPVRSFFLPHGFRAFYLELARSGDFVKALGELRQRTLPEYTALDSADVFRLGWRVYEGESLTGPLLAKRVKRIMRRTPPAEIRSGRNKARREIVRRMRDASKGRDDYYRHFIMADIYPENADRFRPVDYLSEGNASVLRERARLRRRLR
jgi:hypothetical protein